MPTSSPFTAVTTVIVAGGIVELLRIGRRDSDLPPGPPTKPVVGNLADFPLSEPHLRFAAWAKQYGEIFSLKMANGTMVVFGQRIPQMSSQLAKGLVLTSNILVKPGNTPPIDLIPAFKYVPERWAKWKTFCNESRDRHRDYYDDLVGGCERRLQNGKGNGWFIETLLERKEELEMTREMIMYLGEALVEPGSDSTKTYLQNLVLLLLTHPEVQEKAKSELDKWLALTASRRWTI